MSIGNYARGLTLAFCMGLTLTAEIAYGNDNAVSSQANTPTQETIIHTTSLAEETTAVTKPTGWKTKWALTATAAVISSVVATKMMKLGSRIIQHSNIRTSYRDTIETLLAVLGNYGGVKISNHLLKKLYEKCGVSDVEPTLENSYIAFLATILTVALCEDIDYSSGKKLKNLLF